MTDTGLRVEFHESLDQLHDDVVRLGTLAVETIGRGTVAMLGRDLHAAQAVIDGDDVIDALAVDIEETCFRLLALQQPMARDLRSIVCALRITGELERSADLVVNICKASRRIHDVTMSPDMRNLIEEMSLEAASLTRKAIDSFVETDDALASALDDMDDRLDDLQVEFVEAVLGAHDSGLLGMRPAVQLALIGRFYERIGDHAVNMGERVKLSVTGRLSDHGGAARR